MKKALILGSVLILAVYAYLSYKTDYFDKTMIVLNDGSLIATDRTWDSGNELMYETDDEIHIIEQEVVDRIEKRNLIHVFLGFGKRCRAIFDGMISPITRWVSWRSGAGPSLMNRSMIAMVLLALLVTLMTVRLLRTRSRRESAQPESPPPQDSKPLWPPTQLDVVRFFLNLYRRQLGAPADARVEFAQLATEKPSARETYELRVKHQQEWVSRRMTIGPLGEDSGSKSKCYYVIYDVHLVVKIPAMPFDDFDEYISSMEKEGKIVDKLAPKECIIPKVSVILSLIHSLPLPGRVSAELVEEKYVDWLRKSPEYIEYLKINQGFVYFMDLSRYYFLGHIINGLHDQNEAVPAEILDHPEVIWEPGKFKGRYGEENETVCFELRDMYNKCESEIHARIGQSAPGTRITPFNIQSWFLIHLAGRKITVKDCKLEPVMVDSINRCLSGVLATNKKTVEAYRKMIRAYVGRLRAEQDKLVMSGIVTNLLELLAWLGRKKIAMRDLKPDNLLVAGDPRKYPHFLRSASRYSLGIIDVETAVDYETSGHQQIEQPLLGGTPFYATPSHFIRNAALAETFGSLGRILHLQDWHAVMVMTYRVITGGLLFENTARLFAEVKEKIIASNRRTGSEKGAVESISCLFWRSAGLEFQSKIRSQEAILKSVRIDVPPGAARLLARFLKKDIQSIDRSIRNLVLAHPLLAADANREWLLNADHSQVCALAADLTEKARKSPAERNSHTRMLTVFNKIADQKLLQSRKKQLVARLTRDEPCMSAHELLIVMFNTVLKAMYRERWQSIKPASIEPPRRTEDEVSLATTI